MYVTLNATINGTLTHNTQTVTVLGVKFDDTLSLGSYCENLTSNLNKICFQIRTLRHL